MLYFKEILIFMWTCFVSWQHSVAMWYHVSCVMHVKKKSTIYGCISIMSYLILMLAYLSCHLTDPQLCTPTS